MKTVIKSLSAICVGLTLVQCQPTSDFAPKAPKSAQSGSARVVATGLPSGVDGYTLCYEDLFDSDNAPNPADWFYRTDSRFGGFNEAGQVSVGGGCLNIDFDFVGGKYKAGGVISTHLFGYGYYQIYGKLYNGSAGLHQSFWTMGTSNGTLVANDQSPAFNQVLEIDGFEQNSSDGKLKSNYHTYIPSNQASISQTSTPNPAGNWFTMGFEWRPDGLSYYYNGIKVATKSLTSAPWNVYAPQNFWLTALATPDNASWGGAVPPAADAAMKIGSFKYYAKRQSGVNLIGNPGFEYSNDKETSGNYPIGWIETRNYGFDPERSAVTTNVANANYGSRYLVHESYPTPYKCTTKQILEYIPFGNYKLTAHVRSSGGQRMAAMRVIQGGVERLINIPASSAWTTITLDNIAVNSDQLTIAFTSDTDGPNQWIAVDSVSLVAK